MIYPEPIKVDFVHGDATGLNIPAHEQALREAGATFLTAAFRAFGSIAPGNEVTRITRFEPCTAGNSGQKLFLSVEYANPEPGLHSDLFVKFSREFTDAFRDRRRYELDGEVRLAKLSRHPNFPIAAPVAYFADFHDASGTGILITQRIAFGEGGVEPILKKCMDHELDNSLEYYQATVIALARLVAAHQSGQLSPQAGDLFPFDAAAAAADLPIAYDAEELRAKVARYAAFAESCRSLVPESIATPQFIGQMERDALRFLEHEAEIRRFLHADADFVALCHWNTNIDNAWFWRDASGALQAGLLDWGMVRQMNVCYGIWGGLSAADPEIMRTRIDELLDLFARELGANGGPHLDAAKLRLHFDLSVMLLCLALMIDAPAVVLSRLPDVVYAKGAHDPIMHKNEVARSFLHVFTNFLILWQAHDFGASLDKLLSR